MKTALRVPLGILGVVALGMGLVACSSPAPEPTQTSAPSTSSSPSASASSEPTGDSEPYAQDCANLMPDSVMYNWNPNFSLNNSATPAAGSSADIVTELQGTTCNFVNQSSGNSLTISVAHLTPSGVSVLQDQISGSLPSIGTEDQGTAYFGTIAGSGVFEMFATNNFWITIAGPDIASADDIAALKQQILQYLPWG